MNKYQTALDVYEKCSGLLKSELGYEHPNLKEALDILQELVDKKTPKKVVVVDEKDLYYIYYCPHCGATLMVDRDKHPKHLFNFCGQCSQVLDWE